MRVGTVFYLKYAYNHKNFLHFSSGFLFRNLMNSFVSLLTQFKVCFVTFIFFKFFIQFLNQIQESLSLIEKKTACTKCWIDFEEENIDAS